VSEELRDGLVAEVQAGEVRAIAEAMAIVDDLRRDGFLRRQRLAAELATGTPSHHSIIGLTGPPGAGKSTLAGALIRAWVDAGSGVGMVAVDPTSQRSGGALLGDRARLRFGPKEPVFMRSLATRHRLGGLAPATHELASVLRAAYPRTLVETVGVGQSEVAVEHVCDSVVLVIQPGSGDALQFMKAGILEIPDLFVVHKADLGAPATRTRNDLESILALGPGPGADPDWKTPVLSVSAQTGDGLGDLVEALDEHRRYLIDSGQGERRRSRSRIARVLDSFQSTYGSHGLELLGGRDAAIARAREIDGTDLDVFAELAALSGLASGGR